MCYFLYGAVEKNKDIDLDRYEEMMERADFRFAVGTKHDLKMSVKYCTDHYRITKDMCDCGTPVGANEPENKELKVLRDVLAELKDVKGIKRVYMSKNWDGRINRREMSVRIEDLDIIRFLAEFKENCLYTIEY